MSNIQMTCDFNNTPIPNAFIDRFMTRAVPVFSLVYIYGLRNCIGGDGCLSTVEIGKQLNILESDVINAWKYWEKEGLVRLSVSREDGGLSVMYLPVGGNTENIGVQGGLPENAAPAVKPVRAVKTPKKADKNGHSSPENVPISSAPQTKTFILSARPQYTVEELEIYQKQSRDIEEMFTRAEEAMGKYLTYHDLNVIFGLYDWLRLPLDVISYLFTYCAEHDHRDLRYIEKVAIDWAENDVRSIDGAKDYAQNFGGKYKRIMRALGASGHYPSATQRKYMDKWLDDYALPIEVVLEACDKTAVQIGKPRLTYVDAILSDWNARGVRSLEAVKADAVVFALKNERKDKADKPAASKTDPRPRANRFVNFAQREIDYDRLEKMEDEYLRQSLEG